MSIYSSDAGAAAGNDRPDVHILVRSSPSAEYVTESDLAGKSLERNWLAKSRRYPASRHPRKSDVTVRFRDESGMERTCIWDESGTLFDSEKFESMVLPPKTASELKRRIERLTAMHYGEFLRWDEAKQVIPRKSSFDVTDLETGLTFRVQRRAGSRHADVQPLTRKDTELMKRIYDGRWSWKRRAVLVRTGGRQLAGSMHGMPHGGDGIPGNGFSGHFCIHFRDSTTHRSDVPDFAHQLMVHKAAGKLPSFLDKASPEMLADAFLEALRQQDAHLLRSVAHGFDPNRLDSFLSKMDRLVSVRPKEMAGTARSEEKGAELLVEVRKEAAVLWEGQKARNVTYRFTMVRDSFISPWKIVEVYGLDR